LGWVFDIACDRRAFHSWAWLATDRARYRLRLENSASADCARCFPDFAADDYRTLVLLCRSARFVIGKRPLKVLPPCSTIEVYLVPTNGGGQGVASPSVTKVVGA